MALLRYVAMYGQHEAFVTWANQNHRYLTTDAFLLIVIDICTVNSNQQPYVQVISELSNSSS